MMSPEQELVQQSRAQDLGAVDSSVGLRYVVESQNFRTGLLVQPIKLPVQLVDSPDIKAHLARKVDVLPRYPLLANVASRMLIRVVVVAVAHGSIQEVGLRKDGEQFRPIRIDPG